MAFHTIKDVDITTVDWQSSHHLLSSIREQVFVVEQQVPPEEEWDIADADAVHFLARLDDTPHDNPIPVACARLLPSGKIGRMAVLRDYRRQGIGRELLQKVVAYAKEAGYPTIFLDAQLHALDFYRRLGFVAEGAEFLDAGIQHRRMRLIDEPSITTEVESIATASEALAALRKKVRLGRYTLDILSDQLAPALYADEEIAEQVSAIARRSARSQVRILVKDTRPLHGRNHPLVQLSQRLPSRIALRKLTQPPEDAYTSFTIVDQHRLVRFSSETEYVGVSKSEGRVEARRLLEDFNRLWELYSASDPYLQSLVM